MLTHQMNQFELYIIKSTNKSLLSTVIQVMGTNELKASEQIQSCNYHTKCKKYNLLTGNTIGFS